MPKSPTCQPSPEQPASGDPAIGSRRPTSWRVGAPAWVVLGGLFVLLAAACSGERPYLLDATTTTTATTLAPAVADAPPVRSDCQTVAGPGPLQVVIESTASTNPCVALASYQRVEFVNNADGAVQFGLGAGSVLLQPAETVVSEPIGTLLPPGYTGVSSEVQPIIGIWVVDTQEDTLTGQQMGLRDLGPIEIGATLADASVALGAGIPAVEGACFVTSIDQDPYSPLLSVQDGAISMIEVFSPGQFTRSEIGVGTAEPDVVAVYGERLEEQPSPDGNPNRKLLVFVPADEADQVYRLVFELENGTVISMRNGLTQVALSGNACP